MRLTRLLAVAVIAGLFAAGAVIDQRDRPIVDRELATAVSLSVSTGPVTTWFCPGGSGPGGIAELTIEVINAANEPQTATVTATPDPSVTVVGAIGSDSAASPSTDTAIRPITVEVPPQGRMALSLAEEVPGAIWVGALVEAPGSDVIVEQVIADGIGGVGRSSCLTNTAQHWVIPYGSTRLRAEGEQFVVMLLNPFADFAVADIDMSADVGRDSVEGLVIPAGSVVAVNVTDEITVAEVVSVNVEVVSGRLSASWLQLTNGPKSGQGARIAPAAATYAPLWYLPAAAVAPGRRDTVAVANPSLDQAAEVDLEIIADSPTRAINPIELTVPPGRTVLVELWDEARLADVGSFSMVVRSLNNVGVAASIVSATGITASNVNTDNVTATDGSTTGITDPDGSTTGITDPDGSTTGITDPDGSASDVNASGEPDRNENLADSETSDRTSAEDSLQNPVEDSVVVGTTSAAATNAAAHRWLLAAETIVGVATQGEETVGFDDDASNVVLVNPSQVGIALVDLIVDGQTVRSIELGPQRRTRLPLGWLGSGRFVLEVDASSPVIAARELVGLTSRTASLGVAVSEPVFLTDLK